MSLCATDDGHFRTADLIVLIADKSADGVPHDLPTDGRIRIEEPLDVRGPECVSVEHSAVIARSVLVLPSAQNRVRVRFGFACVRSQGTMSSGRIAIRPENRSWSKSLHASTPVARILGVPDNPARRV
jgi:hypothetical protein